MKKVTILLGSLLFLCFMGGNAAAVPFTLQSYSIDVYDDSPSDDGLEISYQKILSEPYTVDLELGAWSASVDLFRIWTEEDSVNLGEDTQHKAITVDFHFSTPEPDFFGQAQGDTYGVWLSQKGVLEWDNNGFFSIDFGAFGDGMLLAYLTDEEFNDGLFGLKDGIKYGANVGLKLKYKNEATPVPEPATMLLLGTGLLGAVAVSRKRFNIAK